ncbi:hypothetical protein BJ138DRAFT_1014491 [Hygrophoropsis aurantiaca]|uniref:Uncharacterized protein n=1 Tax=Hygrophoropsis aurantiaca TaxID=72124 RepID=A0ACB8A1X9_9AGAM|nr:hypothetical protein BJ138DRAFT_1014491 [Hygrophoropsis aurantiaca]
MSHGIPLDTAAVISTVIEGILYGFSLLMFIGTLWALFDRRNGDRVNRKMLTVSCLLLLFSTAHITIDIIRVVDGLVTFRDSFPGGPLSFFSAVSQWSFVYKNAIYTLQTLLGDGVVIYRCYVVHQSIPIVILPVLMWCSVAVTGIGSPYTASIYNSSSVFQGSIGQWITSFYATTLATNLLSTALLAHRIWKVDRRASHVLGGTNSHLRPILHVILDAGVVYSLTLLAALICFVSKSNGQFVILDMVTPIISITFYMVIIRVGISKTETASSFARGYSSRSRATTARRTALNRMEVHVTTLTECKADAPHSFGEDSAIEESIEEVLDIDHDAYKLEEV